MDHMDGNGKQSRSLIVKKSPIIVARDFIVMETIAYLLFWGASAVGYYAQIWRGLPLSRFVSFNIAEFVGILVAELLIIMYAFFRWLYEYYQIYPDRVIYARGLLLRKKTITSLAGIRAVSWRQSLAGKIARFGTIELQGDNGKVLATMPTIADPQVIGEDVMERIHLKPAYPDTPHIESFLQQDEHEQLEFKSTLRWDLREGKYNRALEKSVMKTIAAFLNSKGGHLVIGVDDQRKVIGIEHDYQTLNRKDADGFHNHFSLTFKNMIGPEFRHFVQLNQEKVDDKDLVVVAVAPSPKPVYLKDGNDEEFFVRTGNSTTSLRLSEAASYIDSHFTS
jgi:membrane protein YdbS with pleckstrin-like domain